jgi:hypothetical protein
MVEEKLQLYTNRRKVPMASTILAVDQAIYVHHLLLELRSDNMDFGPTSSANQKRSQQLDRGNNELFSLLTH